MEAKEKAQELITKFVNEIPPSRWLLSEYYYGYSVQKRAKQCALIAVDEILKASTIRLSETDNCKFVYIDDFWQEVKTELEKL